MRLARYHYTQTRIPLFWTLVPKKDSIPAEDVSSANENKYSVINPVNVRLSAYSDNLKQAVGTGFPSFPVGSCAKLQPSCSRLCTSFPNFGVLISSMPFFFFFFFLLQCKRADSAAYTSCGRPTHMLISEPPLMPPPWTALRLKEAGAQQIVAGERVR